MDVFERYESEVRSYIRSWPVVFTKARGHHLWDEDGNEYVDFFAGAGSLNYGHNNPRLKGPLLAYLESDGITHSLDMATEAKARFLEEFQKVILEPRGLRYKVQFPGPTGTNAVEAALKLARKYTGRERVISFTNAFHGMTLGSLAVTGNEVKRSGAGVPLTNTNPMPYDGFLGEDGDTIQYLRSFIEAGGSGIDLPAAIIVETVQGEGGMHTARLDWLRGLAGLCADYEILLIVDDIQMGCGRTGPFFSFEAAGIVPDIVTLSKSISGYGLPLALTLLKPELDCWDPGEHNGTFRGHNPAFVTATAALDFWRDGSFEREVQEKGERIAGALDAMAERYPKAQLSRRGRGMAQGLHSAVPGLAASVAADAFTRGLIVETSGADAEVVKLLPPLTIETAALEDGLARLEASFAAILDEASVTPTAAAAG